MNISEEEKLQLLWNFVRAGQWIEGDKRYAVSREFVLKVLGKMQQAGLLPD